MTTTTKPETFPAPAAGDAPLRRARQLLDAGRLALASVAGWQAAVPAVAGYAGASRPAAGPAAGYKPADGEREFFADAARRMAQDPQGDKRAGEWAASALALYDNARYDWLDRDGVGRRLDDVQRLDILAQDIADPPQNAEDILRRAWQCLDNGALAVASEKGWDAATYAAKTYAEAMGCDHIRSNYLDQVSRLLVKEEGRQPKVVDGKFSALNLYEYASYCDSYPHWLDLEMIAEDIDGVSKLVALMRELTAAGAPRGEKDV